MSLASAVRAGVTTTALAIIALLATPAPANALDVPLAGQQLTVTAPVLHHGVLPLHRECGFCGIWG